MDGRSSHQSMGFPPSHGMAAAAAAAAAAVRIQQPFLHHSNGFHGNNGYPMPYNAATAAATGLAMAMQRAQQGLNSIQFHLTFQLDFCQPRF